MFLTAFLLTLRLASSITGLPVEVPNSPMILPLTRRLNFSNDTIDLVQHDEARAAAFRDYHTHGRRAENIPMLSAGSGKYTVGLGVGSPPITYNLLVDTASAVTWIGARTPYNEAGINTRQLVWETYGGGTSSVASFSGTIFLDTVTLGGELTIPDYELAVAFTSSNIKYDGVLGIGPRDLTANTRDNPGTYPTFTDCLVIEEAIGRNLVGIFFQPFTGDPDTNVGELAFGEPDHSKCVSDIVYADVTNTSPSMRYWGIDQGITYGTTVILFPTAGFIDTGSTFISIASDAYSRYQAATGATFDQPTRLLRITTDQYSALRELKFHIDNNKVILSLSPNAQTWPCSLNSKLPGGENAGIYLIINSLSTETGAGLDFIAGYTFMQRFYIVLDGDNRKVGFASTLFTDAMTD